MKSFFSFVFLCLLTTVLPAQSSNPMTSAADSDPQAKAVMEKMRKKYEAYSSMNAQFRLDIEFPNQPVETQNIEVWQKGDQYKVEMPGRTMLSDGSAIWMIMHDNKEVQITNIPEEGADAGIMSPQSLFRIYESDEFVYVLANELTENGQRVQQIEFKPLDDFSDYSKLRLTLAKNDASFLRVKAFGKDGSRFTLYLDEAKGNTSMNAGDFTFSKADYPDYYIEDLR